MVVCSQVSEPRADGAILTEPGVRGTLVGMTTAYLDANVYNDVERAEITAGEIDAVRAARKRGDITPCLSVVDLEESLGLWTDDRPAAIRRLRVARDLAGFDNLLKQPSDLMTEAIVAYATGASVPSPLMRRPERRHLASVFNKIANGSTTFNPMVKETLADVKKQKEQFKAGMQEGLARSLAELGEKHRLEEFRDVPFKDFFAAGAAGWAEDFADHVGRDIGDACRERGLDGLLGIRTVRVTVGTAMSIVHSQVCGGRKPDFGDSYDLWHAALASATDVLVTRDERLFDHVSRIPGVDGFRVVKTLGELLAGL
jgi:hypothetical protein